MGSLRQSGAIPTCINALIQPRGVRVAAEASTNMLKGSMRESRGKRTALNSTKSASTGYTPAVVLYGREPVLPVEHAVCDVTDAPV